MNVLFLSRFLNSCGCSTGKSKTPPHENFFPPLNGTEHGSQPSLTTSDRELGSVPEVRIEPGDLNQRPLVPQSVTLPTIPGAGCGGILNGEPLDGSRKWTVLSTWDRKRQLMEDMKVMWYTE